MGSRRRATRIPHTQLRAALATGTLLGLGWIGTYAVFTDDATATSGSFTSGSVDIVLAGDTSDAYAFTSLGITGMTPGSEVYAPLAVANTGTLPFTYTMSTGVTGSTPLADGMRLGIKLIPGSTCNVTTYTAGTLVIADTTVLSAAAISSRSLAASGSETLCFHAQLPSGASNALQGLTSSATFTFTATQA